MFSKFPDSQFSETQRPSVTGLDFLKEREDLVIAVELVRSRNTYIDRYIIISLYSIQIHLYKDTQNYSELHRFSKRIFLKPFLNSL